MDTFGIPGHGVVVDGHTISRGDARTEAAQWLAGNGVILDTAEEWTESAPISRAHWAGAEVGFAGPDHPDAAAVTVVNVPGTP